MELSAVENRQLEAVVAAGIQIPSRPQIVMEVEKLLSDADSDNRMIARLIGRDVRLAASVFKVVNSPAFARARKIDNLDQAIAVLGRRQMGEVVNAAGLRSSLGGDSGRFERFWDRSTDIATLCGIVIEKAPRTGGVSAEQAYTVGLFHDCGIPLLMQHIKGYCADWAVPSGPLTSAIDQDDAFSTSHCAVGSLVAEKWNLPDVVRDAIRQHHYVLDEGPARTVIAVLQMATHLWNALNKGDDAEWECQRGAVLAELGIAEADAPAFEQDVTGSFELFS